MIALANICPSTFMHAVGANGYWPVTQNDPPPSPSGTSEIDASGSTPYGGPEMFRLILICPMKPPPSSSENARVYSVALLEVTCPSSFPLDS